MYSATATPTPPIPPPKPNGHDGSRVNPSSTPGLPHTAPHIIRNGGSDASGLIPATTGGASTQAPQTLPDPGEAWLPEFLQDKSKQDLAEILSNKELLNALTRAPPTVHPSIIASDEALLAALQENTGLAEHLVQLEAHLATQRSAAQAQLLSAHALERQWQAKQTELDNALAPFAPSSLYQSLKQGVQEQEMVCQALEESFLEGDGALASEREALEWVRRYRDAKKLHYLRQERRARWNEGRVGGWR